MRFGDLNMLISNQLTAESQILFRRAISERVPELAPFLAYDHDPYIVSADRSAAVGVGRLHPDRPIPERAAARRGQPVPRRELHPQQRQGGDGRLRRHGPLLHHRPGGADHRRPGRRSSRACSSRCRRCRRSSQAHLRYPGGPVHRPEPDLPPLPPAGDRGRRDHLLQPGGPLGDPRGRGRRQRAADGALLRDHAHPRRGRRPSSS